MKLQERINAFIELGKFLKQFSVIPDHEYITNSPSEISEKNTAVLHNDSFYDAMWVTIRKAHHQNSWFTQDNMAFAFQSWATALTKDNIEQWLKRYSILETVKTQKTIAIVMAGNIPLVGFHDFISVLLSGHKVLAKLSSNDNILLPFLAQYLIKIIPDLKDVIAFTKDKLDGFDAVIATGSNNTSRYFEYYFGKYPNIIRKNRNSIAIITGKETPKQMEALADDVFRYFGLGCRNVSKIYIPENYDLDHFFNGMYSWKQVINNHKYMNNYDYNKAVYLMSNIIPYDNEFMLLKEDEGFSSPISVVFFERYVKEETLREQLESRKDHIQCIVSLKDIPFGIAQSPQLWDYADGVDTLEFLLSL